MFARKSVDQLNAEKPLDDVFFDLDRAVVRDDAKPALQKDADWMKKWASVPGDARGPLRLARQRRVQPRARQSPRELGQGIPGQPRHPAGRVTVVSKGKEQPFCNDANESCWQQNRRGHFVITSK